MLTEKINSKFYIQFGNLKPEFTNNCYVYGDERFVENKIMECAFTADNENNKYAIIVNDVCGIRDIKRINLNCFEEWHYIPASQKGGE